METRCIRRLIMPDGRIADAGEIVEIEPQRRLVLSWRHEFKPELKEEGYSRMTYELEKQDQSVKLTIIHEIERDGSNSSKRRQADGPRFFQASRACSKPANRLRATGQRALDLPPRQNARQGAGRAFMARAIALYSLDRKFA
jgi:uncharacterized protein YndB with AHSA1/START domain